MSNDLFDDLLGKRRDLFDEIMAKRENGDLFDKLNKEISASVREYVKSHQVKLPDIPAIVKEEVSKIKLPKEKIIERIVEKVKSEPVKVETKIIVDKESKDDIEKIKDELSNFERYLSSIGGSGIDAGSFLKTNQIPNQSTNGTFTFPDIRIINSGTIDYDEDDLISTIDITGLRTMSFTRNSNGYVTAISDGKYIWTYTRDDDDKITSWEVA